MARLISIFLFYRSFAAFSWIVTGASMAVIYQYGIHWITPMFWMKVLTLGLTWYFIKVYKRREFYYFKNLGASSKFLWISAFSLDLILFILAFILILNIP